MHMEIPDTHEKFTYEIVGYGAEPLSKGNIRLECRARQEVSEYITITNPYAEKKINYLVKSDIPNFAGMCNPLLMAPGETKKYKFTIYPNQGGRFIGQITFQEDTGNLKKAEEQRRYQWWTVEIIT